jgi:SAM-dependent methyltransferase
LNWDRLLALAFKTGMAPLTCCTFELARQVDAGLVPQYVQSTLKGSVKMFRVLLPSLGLEGLVQRQGKELSNLSIRWNGALYASRPSFWMRQIASRLWQWLINLPIRLIGWRSPLYHGDPCHFDRWCWLKKQILSGPVRTLDAGCGSGAFTFYASRIGNEAIGISFDQENNEKAKVRANLLRLSNIRFFHVDLRELEKWKSPLGQFDQIICFEAIEHIQQDQKLLCDLASLLKPKGRIFLTTPFKNHRPLFGERLSQMEDGGHVRWGYTHEEIRALFGSCGLEVVREDFVSGFISQKLTSLMGRISRFDPKLAWVVTFPLRTFQVSDRLLTRLLGYPPLCIGVVGIKRF